MSAFVVDDETINKVVSYIYSKANAPDSSISWKETKLYKMGYDVFSEPCIELAQKMFNLNVAAVNARYGEGKAEKFRPLDFKYWNAPAPLIQVIKALETWKYQCTEGKISDYALYKAMVELHCLFCIEALRQTDEYKASPWG